MPAAARRRGAATHAIVLLVVAVLLLLPLASPVDAHQDRADLSRVQRNLEAVRRVLADARADADRVAAALVQADHDVSQAHAALQVATANYRAAQAGLGERRVEAVEPPVARGMIVAQQAEIRRLHGWKDAWP